MALTKEQKEQLDNIIINVFTETGYIHKDKLLSEIQHQMKDVIITSQSMFASIKRIGWSIKYNSTWGTFMFKDNICALYSFLVDISKDKNLLTISNDIIYDFVTKKVTLKNDKIKTIVLTECCSYSVQELEAKLSTLPEWITNYISDNFHLSKFIIEYLTHEYVFPEKEPKNFYKFVGDMRLYRCESFKYNIIMCEYRNTHGNFIYNFAVRFGINKATAIASYEEQIKKIIKISLNNGIYDFENNIRHLATCINQMKQVNITVNLDTNRDIVYNIKNLETIIKDRENQSLSDRLQILNFINGIIIENEYQIVVPQNIIDLQKEGRMQNNCVGSYYNQSILNGNDLIYFIRRKDDIDNSYITCRYNLNVCKTVECKYKNNRNIYDNNDLKVIKIIDNLINAKLH